MKNTEQEIFDIFIIGGGINGCGIARDAAGRGYLVALAEMNDLASATSSSSTKLFHGGLRYLEFFEFNLVRKALKEREVLLNAMPHISWPMRFVLPVHKDMRFESDTPTSRLLSFVMPWLKGSRPAWLIRFGLFLYDHLGGRKVLPSTTTLDLANDQAGQAIDDRFKKAFEYSDCWVEDARLVILNARDAQNRGANIMPRTKVLSASQNDGLWHIECQNEDGTKQSHQARMIVNAAGPWVGEIIQNSIRLNSTEGIRLVRGSHIVTKRLYNHDKAYFFQGTDGRIIFAIPFEEDFTLIGTTDAEHDDLEEKPFCTKIESDYLIKFANEYFKSDISQKDIVWTYSGVRPLYDDGASSATAATRDYVLSLNTSGGAPVLNIFGGKITTYRKLAEGSLDKIEECFACETKHWTAGVALPGGSVAINGIDALRDDLAKQLPFFDGFTTRRLIRQYGTQASEIFASVKTKNDLGKIFVNGISSIELDWAIENEWVKCAEDFLWRRSKMGLRVSKAETVAIEKYIASKLAK